jgi:hypothetical protein
MSEENLTPWQKYKKKLGDTRPWDLINPSTEWAEEKESSKRFDICKACPEFINLTKQCKKCGCFMVAKTKLQTANCPLGKW